MIATRSQKTVVSTAEKSFRLVTKKENKTKQQPRHLKARSLLLFLVIG